MSETKRNVPKLRFPGFTEDWEQRKLGELFDRYESRVETPHDGYWRLGLRSHCKGTFHTYVEPGSELETSDMNIVKEGNFILNITFAWELALAITDSDDDGKLVSHRFPQFKPKRNLLIKFFKHTLSNNKFKHHLQLASPGGAGRNKVLKINEMLKFELLFPNMEEQLAITKILEDFDNLITLHQRKLENLKLKKKALLQKLFPKNGEQFPELRFPGFTDAWEQRKLGEVAEIVRGASPRPIADLKWFDNKSDIGWLRISDVTSQDGRIKSLEQRISKLGQEKTRVLMTPHLLLSIAATVGKPVINYVPTGVHDGFLIFMNPKFNIIYAFWWLEMFREKWNRYGQPGSQVNLNSELVKNQEISLPSDEEQIAISSFFENFDNLITLHQRKLEHLQLQKKALLQQMFV